MEKRSFFLYMYVGEEGGEWEGELSLSSRSKEEEQQQQQQNKKKDSIHGVKAGKKNDDEDRKSVV